MNRLGPLLAAFGFALVLFVVATTALVLSVKYKPYGVSDFRRVEYEQKLAEIKRARERARNAVELNPSLEPIASVDEMAFNFGRVDPNSTMSHSFVVKNVGDAPLQLELGDTTCKCTSSSFRGDGFVLPGDETEVTLTWNTGKQAEDYEQVARVHTNDPLNKVLDLKVTGQVRAELIGPQHVNLGSFNVGESFGSRLTFYSQLWDDFSIVAVKCDEFDLDWFVEPPQAGEASLAGAEASSSLILEISGDIVSRGEFNLQMLVVLRPSDGGEDLEHLVSLSGSTKAPISFFHPDLHDSQGLDLGTLSAGNRHEFAVNVRMRGNEGRRLVVLKKEPQQLDVSLEELSSSGVFRLLIAVPDDCSPMIFNRENQRGYVQIGDPDDPSFQNWLPLSGAVVR